MACNCKKKAAKAARYSGDSPTERRGPLKGFAGFVGSLFTVILIFILIIVTLPIIIPIGMVSLFTGKSVRIDRLILGKREKKQNL